MTGPPVTLLDAAWQQLAAWVRVDGGLMLALVVCLLLVRFSSSYRPALILVTVFLGLRLVLTGNPWVWDAYTRYLQTGDVGWRQQSVIEKVRDRYLPVRQPPRYLAVGSSQAGIIYSDYARRHEELAVFHMAAMMPLDFVLFREQIARYRPEVVLLYLSDFDLARQQPPETISMAPAQGFALFTLWPAIETAGGGDLYGRALAELLVGEVFPEFKYGFVFRAITDKVMRRIAQRLGRKETQPRERASRAELIGMLRESISGEYIENNLHFLRAFVEYAATRGFRVVMVEGQYHPDVSNAATRRIAGRVNDELQALAREHAHVSFLPREVTGTFSAADYTDLSHVRVEAGYRFTQNLLGLLETSAPQAQQRGSPAFRHQADRAAAPAAGSHSP